MSKKQLLCLSILIVHSNREVKHVNDELLQKMINYNNRGKNELYKDEMKEYSMKSA